jgi:hypothetical protein
MESQRGAVVATGRSSIHERATHVKILVNIHVLLPPIY